MSVSLRVLGMALLAFVAVVGLLAIPVAVLHDLGTVVVIVAAAFAWAFVVGYARDPWRQFEAGRHLMVFTFGHALLLTYIVWRNLAVVTGIADRGPEVVRFLAFLFLAVMFVWRYRILRKGQLTPPRPDLHSVDD